MDKMSLMILIFQSIPESIIIIYLGLASIGVKPGFLMVLPAAALSSLISWLVRALPLPFGLHSIIGLITITFLFLTFFKIKFVKAIIAAMFAFSILLATEAILLPIMLEITDIKGYQTAWGHVYRIFLSLPEQIFLGGIAFLLHKFKISFESLAHGTKR